MYLAERKIRFAIEDCRIIRSMHGLVVARGKLSERHDDASLKYDLEIHKYSLISVILLQI